MESAGAALPPSRHEWSVNVNLEIIQPKINLCQLIIASKQNSIWKMKNKLISYKDKQAVFQLCVMPIEIQHQFRQD